jgi:hypothetical protein
MARIELAQSSRARARAQRAGRMEANRG